MKSLEKRIISIIAIVILAVCGIFTVIEKCFPGKEENKYHLTNFFTMNYGFTNRLIGKKYFKDPEPNEGVYLLRNGNLALRQHYKDASIYKSNIESFNSFLTNLGIGNCYVLTAENGDERTGMLPIGVTTNFCEVTNKNLTNCLDNLSIDYIDTFQKLNALEEDYHYYFYKTDHHWNDYAGIYLAQVISEYLNTKSDGSPFDSSLLNLENHYSKVYKNMFLGSLGNKVKLGYAMPEDFEMLIPKYETNFLISPQFNSTGSYEDALICENYLIYDYYFKDTNCYASYLNGDIPLINIQNLNCDNNKRILVIKDSKANIINAHLACVTEYLDIIDPRAYKGDIREYIEETKPDFVFNIFSAFSGGAFFGV